MNQTATAPKARPARRVHQMEVTSTDWVKNHTQRPCKVTYNGDRIRKGDQVIFFLKGENANPSLGIFEDRDSRAVYFKLPESGTTMIIPRDGLLPNSARPWMHKVVNIEFIN